MKCDATFVIQIHAYVYLSVQLDVYPARKCGKILTDHLWIIGLWSFAFSLHVYYNFKNITFKISGEIMLFLKCTHYVQSSHTMM